MCSMCPMCVQCRRHSWENRECGNCETRSTRCTRQSFCVVDNFACSVFRSLVDIVWTTTIELVGCFYCNLNLIRKKGKKDRVQRSVALHALMLVYISLRSAREAGLTLAVAAVHDQLRFYTFFPIQGINFVVVGCCFLPPATSSLLLFIYFHLFSWSLV